MIVNCPGRVNADGLSAALIDTSDVMPTLVELAGTSLPAGHPIDGKSFVPILQGKKKETRDWIFSYLGDRRVLRTKRYLIENNAPYHFGTLYDCGKHRNGTGYQDVTHSTNPDVLKAKAKLLAILETQSVPPTKRARQQN